MPAASSRRVLDERVAAELATMMRTTTTEGTGRKAFRAPRSRQSALAGLTVAGKTGSLSEQDPFRDYSWFVGFAPVGDPQVAVAAVTVNERVWRVKASFLAHEALKAYFGDDEARALRTAAR